MQINDSSAGSEKGDSGIFRKSSLKKFSSSEQLNQLVEIIDIRFWIALLTIGILIVVALAWAVFGSVEIKVSGLGLMMREGSVFKINSMGEGIMEEFHVKVGDRVKKEQIIGYIEQKGLVHQIEKNKKIIKNFYEQYEEVKVIYDKQKTLLENGIVSALEFAETKQRLLSQQGAIDTAEEKMQSLRDELERNSYIVSHHDGTIIEVATHKGNFITNGALVAIVENQDMELDAVIYFSLLEGKKILKGMTVHIVPTVIKKEEHGFIYGKVISVSNFPITPQGLTKRLPNDVLVKMLLEGNFLYEVCVDLVEDEKTPSGYKWSSRRGPRVQLQTGTMCYGEIVVRKQSPISLVLPLVRKHVLGIGENIGS